ncbi:hypothetical protein RhiirB3_455304 [Rhizophagus irregularis]|nr:hypothetical protein RhiirB3_455304 [Rhizophagus irregularis]
MNWPDLQYLGIVGRKGRIPAWFNFIKNNFLSSSSSSLLLSLNAKVFAAYLPITLSTSWSYVTSLVFVHLTNSPLLSVSPTLSPSFQDRIEVDVLPPSVQTLYTDGSFYPAKESSLSSMTSAWIALDDDGFILESSSVHLPSCFPSALHSEIFAILSGLSALSHDSSISVYTDCSQLISLWTRFVDAPFSPKLLREPNHLL